MRALHLNIKSLVDMGDTVQYRVDSEFEGERDIAVYKDPANGVPVFDPETKARFLGLSFQSLRSTAFFVPIEGGIGDTALVVELLLELSTLYSGKGFETEFVLVMPKARAILFNSFLNSISVKFRVLIREELLPDVRLDFSFPVMILEASPNPYRADQFCAADVRSFLWRKWGFANFVRPKLNQRLLFDWKKNLGGVTIFEDSDKPYLLILPSSSPEKIQKFKTWDKDRWVGLIGRALSEFSGDIYLLDDVEIYESFSSNPRVRFLRLSDYPKDGLDILGSLLLKASATLAVDSGPAHFAGLIGKSITVLWGPTSPLIYGHPDHFNLRLSSCAPCSASSRILFCIDQVCMSDLPVDLVWSFLRERMNEKK